MDGYTFWIVAFLAAFCMGMGKGGVPVVSALAVPVMSLVISPVVAAALLLPAFVVADVFGLYAYRRNFNWTVLRIMMIAMPFGVLVGWATFAFVSEAVVTILIGVIGVWFATSMIFGKRQDQPPQPARFGPGMIWGAVTGFTSFVSHSGATPYQVYTLPLGMDKLTFAGTAVIAFAYINAIKLIPYYALGQLSADNLRTTAVLFLPAVIGVFAGYRLVKVMPEKLFFRIIIWALLLLSLRLLWDGSARAFF